ncbi:MAG: ASCH domain-containing protein [Alphaproteobacteria bacterium]|nr:ASCH domain-containing protein [Alphaproteobacteria bacterium]
MKVQKKYYNLLKNGVKTIELRLFDEKRKKIKIGDKIIFENLDNAADYFIGEVIALHRAQDFHELSGLIPISKTGFNTQKELVETMEKFYPLEKQKKEGVLGIEIKIKK